MLNLSAYFIACINKPIVVVKVVKTLFTHAKPINRSWLGACNKKVQEYLQKLITKDNIN
jgi:hypothetical protein